jgi:hypothetical protein
MPCMPSKSSEPEKRLLHIRDNIHLARKFIEGLDYEAFRDNHLGLLRGHPLSRNYL